MIKPLRVLICGSDEPAMQRMARILTGDGIDVTTSSQPFNCLAANQYGWDFLIIDLDGLNSFLRNLLPSLCSSLPRSTIIGVSTKSSRSDLVYWMSSGLKLDACLNKAPRVEDLIVAAPRVAARYLCDTKPFGQIQ